MLGRITHFLETKVNTETVIGEPFQLGEFSCIPIIRVGLGFGSGGGEGKSSKQGSGEGGGAAGGMGIDPIGFLVSRENEITFIPTRERKIINAVFEKVPTLIEKYLEHQQAKKEEEKE